MDLDDFFRALWRDYSIITPQAAAIHQLFQEADGRVVNDHVAFRTIQHGPFAIDQMEQPLLALGYRRDGFYEFPEKKLAAWSYQTDDPNQPLVFLSELLPEKLSAAAEAYLKRVLDAAARQVPQGAGRFHCGRLWPAPTWADYQMLEAESDYAAWLMAWGYRANHFTVSVNHLRQHDTLEKVVAFLEQQGYALNRAGGVIKGSPELYLEQASTLADQVELAFSGGEHHQVPSCYYEFARRYALPDGKRYRGFVAASADKIFQSTDRQRG